MGSSDFRPLGNWCPHAAPPIEDGGPTEAEDALGSRLGRSMQPVIGWWRIFERFMKGLFHTLPKTLGADFLHIVALVSAPNCRRQSADVFYGRLYTMTRAVVFATGQLAGLMPAATATRWCPSV